MSLLNISNSTQLLKSSSRIILPKCIQLSRITTNKNKLVFQTKKFSSTPLNNASTFDFSKHSNESSTILGYDKIDHLKNKDEIKDSLENVKKCWNQYLISEGFDTNFRNLKIIEEESNKPGKVVMKFVVQKVNKNIINK